MEPNAQRDTAPERIAIIGMSGRFPGARNVDEYWHNLRDGVESIRFFADQELLEAGIEIRTLKNVHYVNAKGVLDGIEEFDANFFEFTPREVELTDPQHRLFLECSWTALEHGGYAGKFDGKIAVYAGAGPSSYLLNNLLASADVRGTENSLQLFLGTNKDFVPTRVSYKLNLKGASVNVSTACSTSLVAVHLGCQSLLDYQSDMVLAGGVGIQVPQKEGYLYHEGGILSPDGHCRAFDARAQGTVSGNGVGVVLLKRLDEALADGDTIHAVIIGSAINNDGADKVGYTAPSVSGQAEVVAEAIELADVSPETIGYVEAHGTGTPLGDPIEVAALTDAFRGKTDQTQFCAIGSVKTNVGHLDEAAGVAGLIKTVLALKHQELPPSLHFESGNPEIDFANSPFFVNKHLQPWPSKSHPRRAGVSSFGIGGTNAHVIIEEAPARKIARSSRPWQLLVMSAKSETALNAASKQLGDFLLENQHVDLADAAYTLQVGRKRFDWRQVVVCQSNADAVKMLAASAAPSRRSCRVSETEREVAFMFSGQGTQYANMGRGLYDSETVFRDQLNRCAEMLRTELQCDLLDCIYPQQDSESSGQRLRQTEMAQPSLFSIEYALAQLFMSWGVRPAAMIGHSIGEYTAACLAGVFSLSDALRLVAARGRLMQQMPTGCMLAVSLPADEVRSRLSNGLAVALINAPTQCVVSGESDAIEKLASELDAAGVASSRLRTSHAFHSSMMDPIVGPFEDIVRQMDLAPPIIPFVSNVTGDWIRPEEATDPAYWSGHLRKTVCFSQGVQRLAEQTGAVLMEVGPGKSLCSILRSRADLPQRPWTLSSLPHPESDQPDTRHIIETMGELWLAGVPIDWSGVYEFEQRGRIPLPSYPFQRQRYWIDPPRIDSPKTPAAPEPEVPVPEAAARVINLADWIRAPVWQPTDAPPRCQLGPPTCWLIFDDELGLGVRIAERLRADGHTVVEVVAGREFEKRGLNRFIVNPLERNEFAALLEAVLSDGRSPARIVNLWSLTRQDADRQEVINRSFYSLLFLVQVFGSHAAITDLQIDVISNGLHDINHGESLCAEKALLLGPVRVTPLEYPQIRCRSIDVSLADWTAELIGQTADQILGELGNSNGDETVAWRDNRRWTQALQAIHRTSNESLLRERGVYMITGGLGSMGLALAQHLAEQVQARLVLVGRSPLQPAAGRRDRTSRQVRVEEIRRSGGDVLVATADVTDQRQMQAVVEQARRRFGAIHGVIHAAGVLDDGLIAAKTPAGTQAVLAPKMHGARVLESVLRDDELDFFVLCSSLASMRPTVGQIDYCAANAFLDAFAHEMARRIPFTVAIDWGFWQELGIIEGSRMSEAEKQTIRDEIGSKELSNMGVAVFERILHGDAHHQVLVSPDFANGIAAPSERVSHPWLESRITVSAELEWCVAHFSPARHWALDEHRIHGRPTLPGTAYLELARAAFECRAGEGAVELRDVYFLSPLVLEDGETRELRTVLRQQDDGCIFHVISRVGDDCWLEHARGEVSRHTSVESKHDGQGLIGRFYQLECGPSSNDNGFAARLSAYPPRWRNIKHFQFEHDEGMALLELPAPFAGEIEQFGLHPALLDNATGFLSHFENLENSLPFHYRRVIVHRPLPNRFYSHVRQAADSRTDVRKYDALLVDGEGTELLRIDGFALREVEAGHVSRQPFRAAGGPENFQVEITSPGHLNSIRFHASPRPDPGPGEIEIEVFAAGLNFIEVLYALGMLPKPPGMEVRFGLECAGRAARVGPGVSAFGEGDEVIAMGSAGFSRYALASSKNAAKKPNGLSFEQAATVPAAYATAWYSLIERAQLRRGERVLIHSASGGVGLAAVNVARHIGAEIFATAGNQQKRDYLRALGIESVADSRSLNFADEVLEQTGGDGVDVVLNSLGGEFIERGLSVLRRHGRFLELGKRDIFKGTRLDMRYFENQLSFMAIDVGPELPGFEALLSQVVSLVADGSLPPLPYRSFPITELGAAIEYMAQAKHIGKIVLEIAGCQVSPSTAPAMPAGVPLDQIIGPLASVPARVDSVGQPPLPSEGHARPELETAYRAPRDNTERRLCGIWQQLLGVDRVGIEDNFFDLFGDSLLAAQLVSRIQQVFGVKLPISMVFDAATVAQQAGRISHLQHAAVPAAADEEGEL